MTARPMTILQVIPQLETGGAERTTLDIADALVKRGDRAIVVSEGGRMLPELEAMGAEHVTMPVSTKQPFAMRRNAKRLAELMEREGVDVIHARSRAPAWSSLWAAKWTRRPFVTTYHGAYKEASYLKNLYNSVMARGDAVIANSAFTAGLIAARHPFARERIVTIHRGIDLSAFERPVGNRAEALRRSWGVESGERVLINVARLTPWKGQLVLIEALGMVRERLPSGWVCVLAGDDQGRSDYRRELEETIGALELGRRVRIAGHVSDVPGALAASAIAVQPSIEPEAFGRAAVEAQAAGLPVIVSDLGAVRETVLAPPEVSEAARTGWRVKPGEAEPLADALLQALQAGDDTLAEIGARGRAHAFTHFSLASMTQKTLAIYDDLLENGKTTLY
ncbi:glycosyl transferase [Acuticoccus sediminis]|uniref:Glycosyl transferase n=1 Tax=Acuticoccus sediminis TaxID=2184697 RepID=A0A8B2NRF6_9HYPH|nr:glycosyltransferase family 4 protein [Acuticoccus sediminis]RAH99601.1 glycosyl transferase [Acuticoccus sediminis]